MPRPRSTDPQEPRFQCTLSTGRTIPDEAVSLLRETHRARIEGEFPRTVDLDLGRYFHQRRLVLA